MIIDLAILEKYRTKYIIEAKPKHGVWYQPFFGWPSLEDSSVKGEIIPILASAISKMESGGEFTLTNKLDTLRFKYSSIQRPTTDQNAVYFFCDVLPSTLVFGDLSDNRKVYYFTPSR